MIVAGAFAAVLDGCGSDGEPAPTATPPLSTAELLQPGPFGVGYMETVLEDTTRGTPANRTFPGSATRILPTAVWYPAEPVGRGFQEQRDADFASAAAPAPLIIYSHGFLGNRRGGAYLAQLLATRGYVVAAADFPLTSFNAPGGATLGDLANQPGDVHFLIDSLLQANSAALSRFQKRLAPQKIGLTGLSLGGATTLLATFHARLRDPRVRAAVAYAPPACFLSQRFFATARVPLAIVHGDIDAIVPYEAHGLAAFQRAQAPKYLFTLRQGSHTAFTDGADTLFGQMSNADDLGCSALASALASDPAAANFALLLGGTDEGIVLGSCPLPCPHGNRNPPALRPQRQLELAKAIAVAHFEAWLRGNASARAWEETSASSENAELSVSWQR
ncbi:MAG: hypothetical protein KatS3mg077_1573 [Candidatus Binatia bacterium]|nr:MAG: hypothetical protein KatS3mg077_1573 [Candidatus Binatia bacterium]